jgi:hypothetical protein
MTNWFLWWRRSRIFFLALESGPTLVFRRGSSCKVGAVFLPRAQEKKYNFARCARKADLNDYEQAFNWRRHIETITEEEIFAIDARLFALPQ